MQTIIVVLKENERSQFNDSDKKYRDNAKCCNFNWCFFILQRVIKWLLKDLTRLRFTETVKCFLNLKWYACFHIPFLTSLH